MYLGLYRESSDLTWGQDYNGVLYYRSGGIFHAHEANDTNGFRLSPSEAHVPRDKRERVSPARRTYLALRGGLVPVMQV